MKNGINNKDPKTGMVSVAIGSHAQDIAHGYAAMSGEHGFRQAGQKATTVPHEQRAIVTAHLPMDWVHKNVDRNFGGNPTNVRQRLADPELHTHHVVHTGSDFSPTETPELRFKQAIPAKYIKGWTQKGKKMKSFKDFSEAVKRDHMPVEDGGPFHIYRIKHAHIGVVRYTDKGFSDPEKAARFATKKWGKSRVALHPWKVIQHDTDDQHESVVANSITAQGSGNASAIKGYDPILGKTSRHAKFRKAVIKSETGAT